MKALVLTAPSQFSLQDFPEPVIGSNDVLIRVRAVGICGSDVHGMDGSSGRRIPPIIMGHEASGEIAALGDNVSGWQVGDRVTFDSTVSCGTCHFCRLGQINLCDNRRVLGVSCDDYRQHGAFAEYIAVPQHILYRLPDELSYVHAAMVEPTSIAFHAAHITPIQLNETAVVVGAGMIGLLMVQTLRMLGCGHIIAVDLDATRLQLALAVGADEALQSNVDDVVQHVLSQTQGRGADLVFEAVGVPATVTLSTNLLRKGGTLTLIGNVTPQTDLLLQSVVTRELRLQGTCGSAGEYDACLAAMTRGAIDVSPFISAVAPLSEGADWFARLYQGEAGLLKVVLQT
jgi:L-iditol 2-dehydrogenase